ncbi:hypothetical protein BCR34DRAFT_363062 [Clohesyomyces aquaticus]|uniref:Uncharacterized protein n=1 Tax=Clohesyomyces aquaticus TaxID=1231657 RepID=A0A1Y1ZJA0_9PLEO|nr:hypothetical protein BCR34DRAFT_363062 [Clohesyomyces aquaticus]
MPPKAKKPGVTEESIDAGTQPPVEKLAAKGKKGAAKAKDAAAEDLVDSGTDMPVEKPAVKGKKGAAKAKEAVHSDGAGAAEGEKKFSWTPENDRKLMVLMLGTTNLTQTDVEKLLRFFPGTTFNGIKIRYSRLRGEQRKLHEDAGEAIPGATSTSTAAGKAKPVAGEKKGAAEKKEKKPAGTGTGRGRKRKNAEADADAEAEAQRKKMFKSDEEGEAEGEKGEAWGVVVKEEEV